MLNKSKSHVLAVPMIMSFEVLKYFTSDNISFLLFASLSNRDLKPKKFMLFFSEILTYTTVGLREKGLLFPGDTLVCGWNLPYLKVNEICK